MRGEGRRASGTASRIPQLILPVLLVLAACGGDSTGPKHPPTPLTIVAGANVTDTVQATPVQALVVEVRDAYDKTIPGEIVRFEPQPANDSLNRGGWAIAVGTLTSTYFSTAPVIDTTDAKGRAMVTVQLGSVAGPAAIVVKVPELGVADTARYTVTPGNAARLVMRIRDTALYAGGQYAIGAVAADRFLNTRPADAVTYTALAANVAVSGAGVVTANADGRASIAVHSGGAVDTAYVSVVPQGTIVYQQGDPHGIAVVNLDRSGYRFLHPIVDASVYPQWSPDGQSIVMYEGNPWGSDRLSITKLDGTYNVLLQAPADTLQGVGFPRFAPDGTIYFGGYSTTGALAIWQIRADGTGSSEIPNTRGSDFQQPAVSPDGRTLLFDHGQSGNAIVALDLASGTTTAIATGTFPVYSPDGTKIAYISGGAVVVADASGANARTISAPGVQDWWPPSWTSDGKWVLIPNYPLKLVRVSDGNTMTLPSLGGYQAVLR